MTQAQSFVLEYEASVPVTRRHLERIPDNQLNWRPDPKSMTLGQLGLHLAVTSGAVSNMLVQEQFELPDFLFKQPESTAEILAAQDASLAAVRKNLWDVSDQFLVGKVSMIKGGAVMKSFVRAPFAREVLLNHNYHHRGQLSVYLRLLGIPVPVSYGNTADENPNATN